MYAIYIMERTQIFLEASQVEQLDRRARAERTTRSDLIRRAVDTYLNGGPQTGDWKREFHEAMKEIRKHPLKRLPPGRIYVERLRKIDARRLEELDRRGRS